MLQCRSHLVATIHQRILIAAAALVHALSPPLVRCKLRNNHRGGTLVFDMAILTIQDVAPSSAKDIDLGKCGEPTIPVEEYLGVLVLPIGQDIGPIEVDQVDIED